MSWHTRLHPEAVIELARRNIHDATIAAWAHTDSGAVWLAAGGGPFTRRVRTLIKVDRRDVCAVAGPPDSSRRLRGDDPLLPADATGTVTGVHTCDDTVTLYRARRRRGSWTGRAWTWTGVTAYSA